MNNIEKAARAYLREVTAPVHALTPNMWFACGGTFVKNCGCGCKADYRPGRWVLRLTTRAAKQRKKEAAK